MKDRLERKSSAMVGVGVAWRGKLNDAATMQLEQHRPARHVLDPSGLVAPVPPFTDLEGDPGAMPIRV